MTRRLGAEHDRSWYQHQHSQSQFSSQTDKIMVSRRSDRGEKSSVPPSPLRLQQKPYLGYYARLSSSRVTIDNGICTQDLECAQRSTSRLYREYRVLSVLGFFFIDTCVNPDQFKTL